MTWLVAFILTVVTEIPVLVAFLPGLGIRKIVIYAFIVNLVSHPLFWYVMPSIFPPEYYLLLGESSVVLIECILLHLIVRDLSLQRAFVASLSMNMISFYLGEVLYRI
jgi:hypothetical protein